MENFNPQFQKIGDILVHQKIITSEQLENALTEQKSTKDKLGNILITQGTISEEELVNAYSMQCGHRSITKDEMLKVDQSIVSLLPEDFAKENNVLALSKKDKRSGIKLEVIDEASAGRPSKKKLCTGKAIRIFTGAEIPKGKNTIVVQENTKLIKKIRYNLNLLLILKIRINPVPYFSFQNY